MQQKLEEVKNSALETLQTRLGDPIIGGYVLSFLVINWKIILYVFSSLEIETKISNIQNYINPSWPDISSSSGTTFLIFGVLHPLILPLLIACFYLFVFPLVFRKAHKFILATRVLSENDRYEAESKLSPTLLKISVLEKQLQSEVQKNNALNDLKASLDETVRLLKNENRDQKEKLSLENKGNAGRDHESLIISKLAAIGIDRDLIMIAKVIANSRLIVGDQDYRDYESQIASFFAYGLIEKGKWGNSEEWLLTDFGKKIVSQI